MQFFASFCRKTAGFYLLYHAVKAFAIQETGFFLQLPYLQEY